MFLRLTHSVVQVYKLRKKKEEKKKRANISLKRAFSYRFLAVWHGMAYIVWKDKRRPRRPQTVVYVMTLSLMAVNREAERHVAAIRPQHESSCLQQADTDTPLAVSRYRDVVCSAAYVRCYHRLGKPQTNAEHFRHSYFCRTRTAKPVL